MDYLSNYISKQYKDIEKDLSDLDNSLNNVLSASLCQESSAENNTERKDDFVFCPECGTKLPAGSRFCMNCGTRIDTEEFYVEDDDEPIGFPSQGIIMTDTHRLAQKYKISRSIVVAALNSYIRECESFQIDWRLLDMADRDQELGEATWMDYSDVLQDFIIAEGLTPSPKLSLFIIGGNDVIPQPAESNPCGDEEDEYQDTVYADFYYCFHGPLPLDFMDYNQARCNVARLPLEMGDINTRFEDDIVGYLNASNAAMKEDGISIGNAIMTSNADWIPASREMSRNLPTPHMENVEGETLDNMYLSPGVMVEMEDELGEKYYASLAAADMLVFNLHGACLPKQSGFYSTGLAFSIDTLNQTNAKIFNTVACWGGRYIKYMREDSMLLNAIYGHGVLLYSGACVPALGKCGDFQYDSTWRIQPAAYSETFMARFSEYQCIGKMPAGETFLKAKCDYYNTSRTFEEDEYTLGTVLMFNLYGNPLLRTQPNVEAIEDIQSADGSKMTRMPFRKMNRETIIKNSNYVSQEKGSLLDEIRGCVNNELRAIHQIIVEQLYNRLGVEPRELSLVERYSTTDVNGNIEKGYLYHYKKQQNNFTTEIRAKVDEHGKLKSAVYTK